MTDTDDFFSDGTDSGEDKERSERTGSSQDGGWAVATPTQAREEETQSEHPQRPNESVTQGQGRWQSELQAETASVDKAVEATRVDSDTAPPRDDTSANWWKGLVGGLLMIPILIGATLVSLALTAQSDGNTTYLGVAALAGLLLVSLRAFFPLCIYFDANSITTTTGTGPRKWAYMIPAAIAPPPGEIVTVCYYLFTRRKYTGGTDN